MEKVTQRKSLPLSLLLGVSILVITGVTINNLKGFSLTQNQGEEVTEIIKVKTVTALGRIEPQGEIIHVNVPYSRQGSRLDKLLVKEGDSLQKGQVVAILDSNSIALNTLQEAEERVKLAEAKLTQIKAGAKIGEIRQQEANLKSLQVQLQGTQITDRAKLARLQAQFQGEKTEKEAIIQRLEAELTNVERDFQRYLLLAKEGAISESDLDSRRLNVDTAKKRLGEAKANYTKSIEIIHQEIKETQAQTLQTQATLSQQILAGKAQLDRILDIREVDVNVIEAEVKQAQASLNKAKTELDLTTIKAPQNGQVLKILTHEGEAISSDGIIRIGETKTMYAVAEIYESDINKIKLGQKATITSNAIEGELRGIVDNIGLEVQRQEVINSDPSANIDNKIVEVKVNLDENSSQRVAGLTNLLVKVSISL